MGGPGYYRDIGNASALGLAGVKSFDEPVEGGFVVGRLTLRIFCKPSIEFRLQSIDIPAGEVAADAADDVIR